MKNKGIGYDVTKNFCKEYLCDIHDIFTKHKIEFFLEAGTLLGAIRENDFITGDTDMDIGVFEPFFLNYKLWHLIIKELDKRKIHVSYVWGNCSVTLGKGKSNLSLDIRNYKAKENEYIIESKFGYYFYPKDIFKPLKKILFLGKEFYIPYNSAKYLDIMYPDWKVPNSTRYTAPNTRNLSLEKYLQYITYIPILGKENEKL